MAQLKKARCKEAAETVEIADRSAAMAVDQLDLKGNSIHRRKADLLRKSTPDTEGLSDDKTASLPQCVWPRLVLVSDHFNPHQGFIDDTEWKAWMHRKARFKKTNVLQQPDLTFAEWMTERDICKDHKEDPSFRSKHFLFNIAFFCNTNRLWDEVTKQLQAAIAGQPKQVQTATVFLLRMAGSPREAEKPGCSGAAAIVKQLTKASSISDYVRSMPFTGRKTYRAVLNREELAIIFEEVATDLASVETCASLQNLCDDLARSIKQASKKHAEALANMRVREAKKQDNTERKLNFHTVQIACDLFTLGHVKLDDNGADCPLAIGSHAGIMHVRRWEDAEATVQSLVGETGRLSHEVQTSLCEYNKYVKWWNLQEMPKARLWRMRRDYQGSIETGCSISKFQYQDQIPSSSVRSKNHTPNFKFSFLGHS